MVYFFIRFESDMLLQCYKAIADFIRNLQDNVDSSMKIQEYLTRKEYFIIQKIWSFFFFELTNDCFFLFVLDMCKALHRRCIEQLYDEHGLDMLDALWEKIGTSTALVILHFCFNQKIDDLSEAWLSLNKTCSSIIANNYHKSLDHRSSSFKQLDKKRMSPKGSIIMSSKSM